MAKNIAVFGIFKTEKDAANAVDRLRMAGFRNTDVSVLISQSNGNEDLVLEQSNKAPEGAMAGAGSGAVLGGALGWLAGIGSLAIPGVGPFIAAGPLLGLLGGLGVGGAVGGFAGALIGAGTPEYEARRYEGRMRGGHTLVSVHCDNSDWENSAKEILALTGGEDICSTTEAAADFEAGDRPQPHRDVAWEYEADFRRNFERFHGDSGATFDDFAPLYAFGFRMANDPEFRGRDFHDVEGDFARTYIRTHPGCDWNAVSSAVLYGWEKAGGAASKGFAII